MRLFDQQLSTKQFDLLEFSLSSKLVIGGSAIIFLLIIRHFFPVVEERFNLFCAKI